MDHIAIDLGMKQSQVCIRNPRSEIVFEGRYPTERLAKVLAARPRGRVILETCSEAFAVADMLTEAGHDVQVVPATLARALGVGERGLKNDQRDARAISAASCRADLPAVHVPTKVSRDLKAMSTARESLVETRTKQINCVRAHLRTRLLKVKRGSPETFPARAREALLQDEDGVPQYIERQLLLLEMLNEQINAANKELMTVAKKNPVCGRLMTIPGVGPITAVRFVAAIDRIDRFPSASRVGSYLGLTGGEKASGEKSYSTSLTKAGSSKVRWTLVQAAWSAMRTRPNDPMVRWATRIAVRRKKHVAAVALARKMAGVMYALWRDGSNYNPMRAASLEEEASLAA